MTPVKLFRDLANSKILSVEKSLVISDFGSKESFLKEEEKNSLQFSTKLKEKFKKDYNLDIDLIEKESKNPPMQTPSFGTNNGFKHAKNEKFIEKNNKKNVEFSEKNEKNAKKMEQINEVYSPKEEKFGHFEFVEKVYQPVLKRNREKVKT